MSAFRSFLYHIQKDARNKPLLVTLLLFAGISLFSFLLRGGKFSFPLIAWAAAYALAGFWLFWSGRFFVFLAALAVAMTFVFIAALELLVGIVTITPGIVILTLFVSLLLTRAMFRTLPESPRIIFLSLLSGGMLSTLALAYLIGIFHAH